MLPWFLFFKPLDHPRKSLIVLFVAWKSLLLGIAVFSPGPGYDTSTTLVQPHDGTADQNHRAVALLRLFSTKLTRWDAIYFTSIASRGYLYEQDWAFGWGFTWLIRFFANGTTVYSTVMCTLTVLDLKDVGFREYEFLESFVGIILSHAAHGLSVLVLHSLTRAIFHSRQSEKFAFITACLHILSPAGIFLSAPYGESTFAFLSFTGYLAFVKSFDFKDQGTATHDLLIAASGLALGLATTVRSNGLLNGLLFLEEAIRTVLSINNGPMLPLLRRLIATGFGGLCIAIGLLLPQYIAFQEFCGNHAILHEPQRLWCKSIFPSIYGFVQSHYWNVGFLRYWIFSNIPLFILASPMLIIMLLSSVWAMRVRVSNSTTSLGFKPTGPLDRNEWRLLRSLATPQLVLSILALTSYHVQIITRISSGSCVWYFWLAHSLIFSAEESPKPKSGKLDAWKLGGGSNDVVFYMIVYAFVQAGLFSSFLPPA